MTPSDVVELSRDLPAELTSARDARRLVTEVLDPGHADQLDVAVLLVSELVTNVLLHAGTTIRVRCRADVGRVRVEVSDGSALMPGLRHYDEQATTGRGLELVVSLADAWGVDCRSDGKTVWFELGESVEPAAAAPAPAQPDGSFRVRLSEAPVSLLAATVEYGDAVLRELALVALAGELPDDLLEAWGRPQFDVGPILRAVEDAAARGETVADLAFTVPAGAGDTALERFSLIEVADRLAVEGELLVMPALPEIGMCRQWLWTQIAEQEAGAAPEPWQPTEPLAPARAAAVLPPGELERVQLATAPTIVADDGNQIVALNDSAAELLGWDVAALVGRRLTVIIPPELRDDHLAGYSRLLMTGEARLIGRPVQVPALRRDGSRVEIELTIEPITGTAGRAAFRGRLRPID